MGMTRRNGRDECSEVYLRFRGVEGGLGVTHVLRALEDAEGETGEEVAGGEEAGGRAQAEAGVFCNIRAGIG